MKTVKERFIASGREYHRDGRNRAHNSLSKLLESGIISFALAPKGKVWVHDNGKRWNLSIWVKKPTSGFLHFTIKSDITNIDAYDVLKCCGKVLQDEDVKQIVKSYVDIDSSCRKCSGAGIIPQFHYYCNGICFDCYGLGYNPKHHHTVEIINK